MKKQNEQTTRSGDGGLVLRQSAVIDEEKNGEIYNHTQHERENKRKGEEEKNEREGEKKCNGFVAIHF